ncbi:MAG: alpha/beta hydrolase [Deltaproteobacteria bacterium]|nr:alpha/beta hydrolase [Deltaproteobacteria bacterium]
MWLIYIILGGCVLYLLLSLYLTYLVHQIPRIPVHESPDWGKVTDTKIPSKDGGSLEVWKVEPEGESRGTVILTHGWSRNRDRMVGRARILGKMGFTTVMHSARDHGGSSPHRFMNAFRFSEDIESVMNWVNGPVILYGHSAGAAGAVIAAHRNRERIELLFLEGCYDQTRRALLSLYRSYNRFFGIVFAPMVILWMEIFYRAGLNSVSPARLARDLDLPVLIIHGEEDRSFPLPYARALRDAFPAGRAEFFVARGADHSSASLDRNYPEAIKSFVERHHNKK